MPASAASTNGILVSDTSPRSTVRAKRLSWAKAAPPQLKQAAISNKRKAGLACQVCIGVFPCRAAADEPGFSGEHGPSGRSGQDRGWSGGLIIALEARIRHR